MSIGVECRFKQSVFQLQHHIWIQPFLGLRPYNKYFCMQCPQMKRLVIHREHMLETERKGKIYLVLRCKNIFYKNIWCIYQKQKPSIHQIRAPGGSFSRLLSLFLLSSKNNKILTYSKFLYKILK